MLFSFSLDDFVEREKKTMQRIKTSFQSFALATKRQTEKTPQAIKVRCSQIIRGDLIKCLECFGQKRIAIGKGGKVSGFYPKNKPYPHLITCSQKGRF
jgi:hypothetical protein